MPRCVPLIGTTFAVIGDAAQGFFRSVVAAHAASQQVVSDALQTQNLGFGQHSTFWRRRISVGLRIAVATQVVARVRGAISPGDSSVLDRELQAARCWQGFVSVVRGVLLPSAVVTPPDGGGGGADKEGVAMGFCGDVPFPGVVGSGFARGCDPAGA